MIQTQNVHETIARHQLADALPLVPDIEKSHDVWVHDALSGHDFLDAFTCFASWPVGYDHPHMRTAEFRKRLMDAALVKISNSDLYTRQMAEFADAFATHVTPHNFPHHFWVSGGALAVENALKTAFDWKARKLGRTSLTSDRVEDLVIVHFEHAFHGRSGYTMSLTNTTPEKTGLYPRFDWPRIHAPAIVFDFDGHVANDIDAEEAKAIKMLEEALTKHRGKVAAIIIEPMQGEGGDNHFRPEFLAALRTYADQEEALLIFDEVQTGFYGSGSPWLWQRLNVEPDVVAFGKKTQVCGIYANRRIDEVADNVFKLPGRINSTWGSTLTDMVRCQAFIEIIRNDRLDESIDAIGRKAVAALREIARSTRAVRNVRGVGSLIAFTAHDPETRNHILRSMFDLRLLALPCGDDSIRFRLPLIMTEEHLAIVLERTEKAFAHATSGDRSPLIATPSPTAP